MASSLLRAFRAFSHLTGVRFSLTCEFTRLRLFKDDSATGMIVGITSYTTKHHIARATLEATCFQTRAILDAMALDSKSSLKLLKVDGGMTESDICMQIQVYSLPQPIDRTHLTCSRSRRTFSVLTSSAQ